MCVRIGPVEFGDDAFHADCFRYIKPYGCRMMGPHRDRGHEQGYQTEKNGGGFCLHCRAVLSARNTDTLVRKTPLLLGFMHSADPMDPTRHDPLTLDSLMIPFSAVDRSHRRKIDEVKGDFGNRGHRCAS